jgi:hypothetical protein
MVWICSGRPECCKQLFLKLLDTRLIDQFLQEWTVDCIIQMQSYYVNYKSVYGYEHYHDIIERRTFRLALVSIRSSSHPLMIKKCRHTSIESVFLVLIKNKMNIIFICLGRQTKQIMVAKFQTLMCLFANTESSPNSSKRLLSFISSLKPKN